MAVQDNVSKIKGETVPKVATMQPAEFNGIRFRATNLYENNDSHKAVIDFARKKAIAESLDADEYGVITLDVSGYTIRLHGFQKPERDTSGNAELV